MSCLWPKVLRALALLLIFMAAVSLPAQQGTAQEAQSREIGSTGAELVQIALQRNREFLAAQARVAEAEALLRQAGVRLTPTIEVESTVGKILGSAGETEYSAAYFHPIETAGKRSKRIEVAQNNIELAQAEVDEQRRQLAFRVKASFIQAVAEGLRLSAINRLIPINRENYQIIAARVELGDAAPLEQQLLLTDVNRAEAQQVTFTSRREAALLELKAAVGLSRPDSLSLTPALESEHRAWTLQQLLDHALQNRADLRILNVLEQQALAEAELAKAEGRPDLTTSIRYTNTSSRFEQFGLLGSGAAVPITDRDNLLSFGLAVPLFTRRRTQGTVDAALSRQAQARLRRDHLVQTISQEVEAAYRRWQGARRAVSILQTGVIEQSERNLNVIREAYRLGRLRVLDVLNEQRRVVENELAYVDAQAEEAQALAELERTVGGNLP